MKGTQLWKGGGGGGGGGYSIPFIELSEGIPNSELL